MSDLSEKLALDAARVKAREELNVLNAALDDDEHARAEFIAREQWEIATAGIDVSSYDDLGESVRTALIGIAARALREGSEA